MALRACLKIFSVVPAILLYWMLGPGAYRATAQTDSLMLYPPVEGLRTDLNAIEYFHRQDLEGFVQAWNNSSDRKLKILHLGDSHVQGGFAAAETRKVLRDIHQQVSTGFIFPYSVAKSYSPFGYRSVHTGTWTYGSSVRNAGGLPLGVGGYTLQTSDSAAGFTLIFKEAPSHERYLRIFLEPCDTCFDLVVQSGGWADTLRMNDLRDVTNACIGLDLVQPGDSLTIRMLKQDSTQKVFRFYGMSLESPSDNGLVYHAAGISGAQFIALNEQVLLEQQIRELNPDLIILDFGTNDIIKLRMPDPGLEAGIRQAIDRVKAIAPDAGLLLCSVQDMYYRKKPSPAPEWFSVLLRNIAREKHCAYYDWYRISGGRPTIRKWVKAGLAQPDKVHLSGKGYRLKGLLLARAMESTVNWLNAHPAEDSLVLPDTLAKKTDLVNSRKSAEKMNPGIVKPVDEKNSKTLLIYRVQPGDTLGEIARKHSVSIRQLKQWNGIKGSLIRSGQRMKIYTNQGGSPTGN